ncbi:MAG: alpha-ketoglutarate-dependent dioxygenase AlkB family protein [Gemmataceae bacterium]
MPPTTPPTPDAIPLSLPEADVVYYPHCFPADESDMLMEILTQTIAWQQERITLYGRNIDVPRLVAWYGEEGKAYTYSGILHHPRPWTPELRAIKQRLETVAEVAFNSVLLNLYRHERDSVAWHSDDEPELGVNPVIASVSFGATRRFQFKHKKKPKQRHDIDLTHGSLLLMRGPTQHRWLHQLPKSSRPCGPRINLTFRIIN